MSTYAHDEASRVASSDTLSADERTLVDHPETGDEGYGAGRLSSEVSDGDHDILESEDERERLLTQKEGISGLFNKGVKIGKRDRNAPAKSRERKRGHNGETSALMYEMEEGIGVSNSSLSRRSSESDERRLLATASQRKVCWAVRELFPRLTRGSRHVVNAYGADSPST